MTFLSAAFVVILGVIVVLWILNGAIKMFNDLFR